jgi:hypothetical protein
LHTEYPAAGKVHCAGRLLMRPSRMNAVRRTERYCVFQMPFRTSGTTRGFDEAIARQMPFGERSVIMYSGCLSEHPEQHDTFQNIRNNTVKVITGGSRAGDPPGTRSWKALMRRSRMNSVRRTGCYYLFRMPFRTSGTTLIA